ncbi:helix-turn-helix domain-containing protein, partial [Clostridioides difficile]|uniref:helix-turn-helix domain-containing protein n=1 Tax=Clostridioides difficile TaxID=1496 RepID=UPI001F46420E
MIVVEKAYKFRMYPNKKQQELINKTFGCCRFVYNKYLAKRIDVYKKHKETFTYKQCSSDLTNLKKELKWLKDLHNFPFQTTLRVLVFLLYTSSDPPCFLTSSHPFSSL